MSAIYCISYNNYFNRTVKREESLAAYLGANNENVRYTEANFNFNPNDGANAVITVGRSANPANSYGDYLLVVENGEIASRWFILDEERLRGKQYRLNLRRDIVADYYEKVLNSTAFIEKGLPNEDSTLIFNSEGIPFNQIKKGETPLIDDSKMAWIIGFVARDSEAKTISINSTVVPDFKANSLGDWSYNKYVGHTLTRKLSGITKAYVRPNVSRDYQVATFTSTQVAIKVDPNSTFSNYFYDGSTYDFKMYLLGNKSKVNGKVAQSIPDYFTDLPDYQNDTDFTALLNMKGKILEVGTNTYYKIDYDETPYSQETFITEDKGTSNLYTTLQGIFKGYEKYVSGDGRYKVIVSGTKITLKLTPVVEGEYTIDYPAKTGRLINKNAPFDLFCIPFADSMKIKAASSEFQANKEFSMSIGNEIARNLGAACYDVQLLPFCPMTGFTIEDNGTTFNINSTDAKRTTFVKNANNENVYALFWSAASAGTKNIFKSDGTPYATVSDKKIENECDFYRLVSPNYNGQFEFSAAKNGGVRYFNVDYTYLPYSSYIHVNPDFAQLYGQDFNDARGLICQGDFSIMYLSDAWVNYQVQNKNYNNIFDREIQNMDTVHGIENTQKRIAGAINAAATGAAVAAAGSGIIGKVVSAGAGVIAAGASYAGAEADILFGNKIYEENKSYKKDIFEYSLDNVRALPNSIAKTTAYTENNKIFPVLEYYSCTDEEKNILANEIAQRGMTIGSIDYIASYASNTWEYKGIVARNFIKAQLIKTDIEDNHIADVLSTELAKGLYFEV
jgi:hypothetical protein